MKVRRAVIIGSAGQDGRLLTEYLQHKPYALTLVTRHTMDITDASQVQALVRDVAPDEIYYLASHHHSSEADTGTPLQLAAQSEAINVSAWQHVLEAARYVPKCRCFYASSCLIFTPSDTALLHEQSPMEPQETYGHTKLAAMQLAAQYRQTHGLHVSCGILFNHESTFRQPYFLSKKIAKAAADAASGRDGRLVLGNLQAVVDWGDAADYVAAMHTMLQQDSPDDYVVATGVAHTVRDFVEVAFRCAGAEYTDYVTENASLLTRRPQRRIGDATKLRLATGWEVSVSFEKMVQRLVECERKAAP
jgi:GDPmannose 4,6-dehydratase